MVTACHQILRIPRLAIENVRQGYLARRLLPAGVVHHGVLREDGRRMWSAMSLPDRDRPIHVSLGIVLFYLSPLPQKAFCPKNYKDTSVCTSCMTHGLVALALLHRATSSSASKDVSFRRALDNFRIMDECLRLGDTVTKITSPWTTRKPKQQCPILCRIAWQPAMFDVVFK